MVGRLREAEQSQLVTELRRKIAELEVQVCYIISLCLLLLLLCSQTILA